MIKKMKDKYGLITVCLFLAIFVKKYWVFSSKSYAKELNENETCKFFYQLSVNSYR